MPVKWRPACSRDETTRFLSLFGNPDYSFNLVPS